MKGIGVCSITSVLTKTPPLSLQNESILLMPEPNLQSKQVASVPTHRVYRLGNPGKATGREGKEKEEQKEPHQPEFTLDSWQ